MSFISHMVISLKNNKRERTSTLKKIKNFKKTKNIEVVFKKKANSYQLKKIRNKLKQENKRKMKKNIMIFFIVMSIVIYVIGFVKF